MTLDRRLILIATILLIAIPVMAAPVGLDVSISHPNPTTIGEQTAYLKVSLTGVKPATPDIRASVNVAFVIDESGSMDGPKIEKAKEAAIRAVGQLGPKDVVSVVSYDSTVNVLVPATRMANKQAVVNGIKRLKAGGDTALYAGVSKGVSEVKKYLDRNRVNRVVLISDGQANVGPSSVGELKALGQALIQDGISVSTIGLGSGYNEDVMAQLAAASDGNHAFAVNAEALTTVFDREFRDMLSVVAQRVTIDVDCAPGVIPVKVLGREAEIIGQTVSTTVNQLYGDREKYVLLELVLPPGKSGQRLTVASVDVSYSNVFTNGTDTLASSADVVYQDIQRQSPERVNKKVMVSVASQIANGYNLQAVELRDQGKVEEAEEVLEMNANYLREKAQELESDTLEDQSTLNTIQKAKLNDADWSKNRKMMRVQQYKMTMQQQAVPSVKKKNVVKTGKSASVGVEAASADKEAAKADAGESPPPSSNKSKK